jgi:tetratricopeptide (TPR) repeat protein
MRDEQMFAMGLRQFNQGNYKESLKIFLDLAGRFPEWPQVFHNIARIYAVTGKHDEAIAYYKKVLQINPRFSASLNNLAALLSEKGKIEEASILYETLLTVVTDGKEYAHYNYGHALAEAGDLDNAIEQFHQAIQLNSRLISAHYNLGLALYKKRAFSDALPSFQKTIEIDATHTSARFELALTGSGSACVFVLGCFQPAGLRSRYSSRFSSL